MFGFSTGLDQETQEKIGKLIQEILEVFVKEFPVSYTVALVDSCKEEVNPPSSELDELQLEAAPTPDEPLKEGTLMKVTLNMRFDIIC
jgi:hypothetical protein